MWLADGWKDYEILDTSDGEKLERWGDYILVRPDPQVIWKVDHRHPFWKKKNAHYHRSSKGGGSWEFLNLPEQWNITYPLGEKEELQFGLKPFRFKHTGVFPEQAVNWEWLYSMILQEKNINPNNEIKILNLFAYTGGATLACAKAGAKVTHVDASKGMVQWAKENARLSGLEDAPIRYLVDDCGKFVEREIRRQNRYQGIIMDPPSYGRGPKGEIWKIEDSLFPFLERCMEILDEDPLFVLINSYTTGLQPGVLTYMMNLTLKKRFGGCVKADEIGIPVTSRDCILPCGASGRYQRKEYTI